MRMYTAIKTVYSVMRTCVSYMIDSNIKNHLVVCTALPATSPLQAFQQGLPPHARATQVHPC